MATLSLVVFLLGSFVLICYSEEIRDLRQDRNFGPFGRFTTKRSNLEEVLRSLGLEGRVNLLTSSQYDGEFGEFSFGVQTFEDTSVLNSDGMVGFSAKAAFYGLPVVTEGGSHVLIVLVCFTDASPSFNIPFLTNFETVYYVESIEIGEEKVTLRDSDAEMIIKYHHDEACVDNQTIAHDFDEVYGSDVRVTSYPAKFDWGCNDHCDDVSYCRALEPFMEDLLSSSGNVCTTSSTTGSRRCQAGLEITSMTGIFESAIPNLCEELPNRSFEAEWVDREHGVGIVYPCF